MVEVVGFREGYLQSVPLGDTAGIRPGDRIVARGSLASVPAGDAVLGRVIDPFGRPLDALGPLRTSTSTPLQRPPVNPLAREPIVAPIGTGVRAIDALLTCGRGQRVGLFGGSGVGKSTLLGMMARGTSADVVVLALVGERGREVRAFLEHDLGAEGLARSVVVVSTSDSPPLLRMRAAYAATALAEHFRDEGKNVLLMMDSVTRFAMAQREVGLAAGEPPTAKGYPPSVFALLAGAPRTRGQRPRAGQHHRALHGARRGRRHQRADRRRRARHSRRPHRPVARSGGAQSLSGHRHPPEHQPDDARCDHGRAPAQGRAGARLVVDHSRHRRSRHRGRLRARQQSAHRRRARSARGARGLPVPAGRHLVQLCRRPVGARRPCNGSPTHEAIPLPGGQGARLTATAARARRWRNSRVCNNNETSRRRRCPRPSPPWTRPNSSIATVW